MLNIHSVHEGYMREKPKDYLDALTYIESFNVKQRQKEEKRLKNRKQKSGQMEMETAANDESTHGEEIDQVDAPDDDTERKQIEQEMFLLETEK